MVWSAWSTPTGASSVLFMELSPPAPSAAIGECIGDEQHILFYKPTTIRIVNQRLDRGYGAGRLLSGP